MRAILIKVMAIVIAIVVALIVVPVVVALIIYPDEYVYRILVWREVSVNDYLHNFPKRDLVAAEEPFHFVEASDEQRVIALLQASAEVDNWDTFLADSHTQAFIVIQDGAILYETYPNGLSRDSMVTSFSVAKSFTSALIGIAIEEGYISSVNDPITTYLPELAARDPRFSDITVRHLLMMASGLEFKEDRLFLFSGDGPLTSYYPDQRQISLENTHIVDPSGTYFQYNKYHPQLLGMIIERTTGMTVTDYLQQKLWSSMDRGAWTARRVDLKRWKLVSMHVLLTLPSSDSCI